MTRKEAINTVRNIYQTDKEKEALQILIPELKESEDERVRKALIDALKTSKSVGELKFILPEPTREECIAYLEKMKEENKAIDVVDRIDKYIDENVANAHDMKDSNPDKKYYRGWDDALGEMARILQDVYSEEKQKEHKKENLRDFIDNFPYSDKRKEQKPNCKYKCPLTDEQLMATDFWKVYLKESLIPGAKPNKQDIEFLLPTARNYFSLIMKEVCTICKDWSNGYRERLESGEQKSIERSEEDEKIWEELYEYFRQLQFMSDREFSPSLSIDEILSWLKSLPERFNLQPKQEWSEDIVRKAVKEVGLTQHQIDWFKTNVFPPKKEWNDEDEHRRDGIIQWLHEYQKEFNPKYDSLSIESIESLIDWLKSLRPSWKPTEEQMGALDYAYGELFKRGDVGHNILGPLQKLCDECRRRIKELSKQIKKS